MHAFIKRLYDLDRLDALLRRKATGCPDDLARKFDCSKRTVHNLIDLLRGLGAEIRFDRHANSYVYDNGRAFYLRFGLEEQQAERLGGGLKMLDPDWWMQNFCQESGELWS